MRLPELTMPSESAMEAIFECESSVTERYQTTVPAEVRAALKIGKYDKLHYKVLPSREVVLTRGSEPEESDPVVEQFLAFLARDFAAHPERLRPVTGELRARLDALVGGVDVGDLDAPLPPDGE